MRFNLRATPCSGYRAFTARRPRGTRLYRRGRPVVKTGCAGMRLTLHRTGLYCTVCQHPLSSLKGDPMRMRVVVHYLVATVILTVYGGQV